MIQNDFEGRVTLFGEWEIMFQFRFWTLCTAGHLFKLSHHAEALGLEFDVLSVVTNHPNWSKEIFWPCTLSLSLIHLGRRKLWKWCWWIYVSGGPSVQPCCFSRKAIRPYTPVKYSLDCSNIHGKMAHGEKSVCHLRDVA